MPIDTSMITGTKAHKHTLDSSDGSALDFTGVSLSSLGNGSMTFANGGAGALQELAIGTVGTSVTSNGSLPVWSNSSTSILSQTGQMLYASAPNTLAALNIGTAGQFLATNSAGTLPEWSNGAKLELIEHYEELAASGSSHTFIFNADLTDDYAKIILTASYWELGGQLYVTINNITSGVYYQGGLTMAGTREDDAQTQLSINHDTTSGDTKTAQLDIYGNSSDGRLNGFWKEYASLKSFETGGFYMGSQQSGTITSIELSTSAGAWTTGSTFDVFGYKV